MRKPISAILWSAIFALGMWSLAGHAAKPAPLAAAAPTALATTPTAASCPSILQKTFRKLQDDSPQDLCQYAGKVLLVVNTASKCGFTSQYEGLENLYAQQSSAGLVVLGFPSNDFGQQEPGDSKQIAEFCFNTYGVKFPMFEKSTVVGPNANPLYIELTKATGRAPGWNFYKYLIGRDGKVLASYSSMTSPDNSRLLADVKKALNAR